MKKAMGIIVLGLLLSGCGTTQTKVEKNKITIGMSKEDFCFVSPIHMCFQTMGESYNNKVRGIFYPDTKMEIVYGKKKIYFFVFENVNKGINYRDLDINGDGTIVKIFRNLDEAKDFASTKKFEIEGNKIQKAKKACKDLGFEPGTEVFAECSLKKLKEQ